jgi:hypothetical protein
LKKNGEKISGGKTGQKTWGNKRYGYSSNAIAKLLKIKCFIVALVIKVI